ncbi:MULTISPECIES: Lin1244/Lin1753 domain-containing protein [Sphingobacterium]|uniref:Lin1244/Lin1753 domain-containing protein n=1 Tax=Sphingobacterium TaxID=28453 RepID=UPI00257C35DF|nr:MULTISPECIES: Lin1244/Lin1753 domain-containing protein [Sphingobacterium]
MAKESFYFSHDYGSRNDPKLVKVLMKLKQEGKGVYWDLIEMLYEQGGYLMLSDCDSYAFALRTSEECINSLINDFGLFENDGQRFWSESVLRRMNQRNAKSEKAKESALKRWNKPDSNANASKKYANALPTQSNSNAIKERKEKEIKEEIDKEENTSPSSAPIPVFKRGFESMEEVKDSIINDENSLMDIGAVAKVPDPKDVKIRIEEFFTFQKAIDKFHTDRSEFKKHFFSWYAKKYPNNGTGSNIVHSAATLADCSTPPDNSGKWLWLNNGWRDTTKFTDHQKQKHGLK